jgi:Sec-independent protein secretion pathway component TatC
MGIFTKLLRDFATDLAYKFGMFAPLCFTYIIGMDLAEQLSKQYKINKLYFQFGWNTIHYFWVFFYLYLFMNSAEKFRRKYHMIQGRKC